MEVLNVLVVVLAAVGSALAQQGNGPLGYEQALSMVRVSSDLTNEVAQDALAKIEDIGNTLTIATAEARFALIHVANFATVNDLTALEEAMPEDPANKCVGRDSPAIKAITKETAFAMVKCFTDLSRQADDLRKDTLALKGQAAAIMPRATERIEACAEAVDGCVEAELRDILQGCAVIEEELEQNVARAQLLLGLLNSGVKQCLGQLTASFITEVGKYGSKMVACFVNDPY